MWNFPYHVARNRGALIRVIYRALLPTVVSRQIANEEQLDLDVFTYSGEAALPEQVASARSFLKFAGRPVSFTIVSDGSYSRRSISLLRKIDPIVRVVPASEFLASDVAPEFRAYLANHPTGKQLALILSLPRNRPALYFDSDVLFFPGARVISDLRTGTAFYLPDCQFAGDERLLRDSREKDNPANTGVLLLFRRPNWSIAFERFRELNGPPNFFTNQTLTHLVMQTSGAEPLDAQKFVLQLDDQFELGDRYAARSIALRHYVNPVRHKFWSSLIR
ncbi:MAG: hypothetical protein DLM52_08805 [Chthoniobacterales bacterium]|nr:MAG: hypothetical protein DLM52_08805 [Chthoniobacterales bacterium]